MLSASGAVLGYI